MTDLTLTQYLLVALIFVWSGFVRSGLGFGGAALSLPFLLLVDNRPLVYLPIISVHLLFFATLTVYLNNRKPKRLYETTGEEVVSHQQGHQQSTVDWTYLRYSLGIMIIPKLIGVFGLITLPATIMSGIIFTIIACYSFTYIFNKPFKSQSKTLDIVFLMIGAYLSGTSLIGAPLIIAVYANHIAKHQLRDTLFMLWVILVSIKMLAFIWAKVDLQLIHTLILIPCAGIGHLIGLRVHTKMLQAESAIFYRVLGSVLLTVSSVGLARALLF